MYFSSIVSQYTRFKVNVPAAQSPLCLQLEFRMNLSPQWPSLFVPSWRMVAPTPAKCPMWLDRWTGHSDWQFTVRKHLPKRGHIILIFRSLILDSFRAARHNWLNSEVCRASEICDSRPLSFFYFLHSLQTVCVASSSPVPLPPALFCTHNPFCLITSAKCYLLLVLLTLQHDKVAWKQPPFSSSLAVNPAHVEEVLLSGVCLLKKV